MEYVDKQIELEMTERKAREDLNAFKKQYNYFSNSSSNRADGENSNRDREGNRDRDGHKGDRDRNHTSNGNRGGRGGGGGGVEGNGAWGHHDEDHRDNRGEKRDGNSNRHGASNSKGNTGDRNQRTNTGNSKEKDNGKVNTRGKAADTSAQQGAPALPKSRGRVADTEAPLIAIPPPPSAAVGSDNSSSVPVSRQVTKNRNSRVKSDNYDAEDQRDDNANPLTAKNSSRNRRRTGAAVLNVVDSLPVAGLNVNTGDTAFALVAAAAAARNAPKMEKKNNGSSIAQEASTEPLEKLLRKPRNNSAVKEVKSPDSSATTFTVVLPSNPPSEGKSDGKSDENNILPF